MLVQALLGRPAGGPTWESGLTARHMFSSVCCGMTKISQNPRKRRRFLENEFYAQTARYWIGKSRPIDVLHTNPVNRFAASVIRPRRRGQDKAFVYALKFTLIDDPSVVFIKIGVTCNIKNRFLNDADRFSWEILSKTNRVSRDDALTIEASILESLATFKTIPVVPLQSGNTECLVWSESTEVKVKEIFAGIVQRKNATLVT